MPAIDAPRHALRNAQRNVGALARLGQLAGAPADDSRLALKPRLDVAHAGVPGLREFREGVVPLEKIGLPIERGRNVGLKSHCASLSAGASSAAGVSGSSSGAWL